MAPSTMLSGGDRLAAERRDLVGFAGRLQLDRFDRARADVEADERFRSTKHRVCPILRGAVAWAHLQPLPGPVSAGAGGKLGTTEGSSYQNRQFCAVLAGREQAGPGGRSTKLQSADGFRNRRNCDRRASGQRSPIPGGRSDSACLDNPPNRLYPLGLPSFERGRPPAPRSGGSAAISDRRRRARPSGGSAGVWATAERPKGIYGFVCPHCRDHRPAVARD